MAERFARWFDRTIAHNPVSTWLVFYAEAASLMSVVFFSPSWESYWWLKIIIVLVAFMIHFVYMIAMISHTSPHNSVLCTECVTIPDSIDEVIEKRRWVLRLCHIYMDSTNFRPMWLGVLAAHFGWLVPIALVPFNIFGGWLAFVIWLVFAMPPWTTVLVHYQLEPWCPFCPRDDDGEYEETPDPDPSMIKTS